jgi:hypothetical protein
MALVVMRKDCLRGRHGRRGKNATAGVNPVAVRLHASADIVSA